MAVPKKRTSMSKKGVFGSGKSFFISEISLYGEFKRLFCATNK